ncbi:MAG: PEGA domain-containing protein [Myxococcota bacterium]|nr:PEGA domain-containing protein [Myxococcota bacterium]
MRKTAPAISIVRVLGSLAIVACTLAPAVARADASVMVLGITSPEGDDEFARNLTGAIRHEASQVDGWQVSDREVTLSQMSLAHGCADTPDAACLRQIATTLNAQRVVYGTVRRDSARDFQVTLSLFDAETGQIERSVEETLPGARTDIDDLRAPARTLVARLSGPQTGSLSVASNAPGATVRVDGDVAGTTDGDGNFEMPAIPVGPHRVQVSAEGREDWSGDVTIARGTDMTLDAELPEGAGDPGGGGGGPSINWAGIALIAGGAAAFGVTIYTWSRLQAINDDPQYSGYLAAFEQTYDPDGDGRTTGPDRASCQSAASGDTLGGSVGPGVPGAVAGLCSEGDTLEVLQYVFLGVAIAAAGAGALLMILDGGDEGEPEVTLTPSFGPNGGTLGARVRF